MEQPREGKGGAWCQKSKGYLWKRGESPKISFEQVKELDWILISQESLAKQILLYTIS